MTEDKVRSVGVVMFVDDPVPINESLKTHRKLLDVFINFVKAGGILGEFKLVGTDGGSGRSEDSKRDRFHP